MHEKIKISLGRALMSVLCVFVIATIDVYSYEDVTLHKDTITVNGRVLKIRSEVEIDTMKINPEPKWIDDAELMGLIRFNAGIGMLPTEGVSGGLNFYRVMNNNHLPEVSFELSHPTRFSNQLYYKFGSSIGLATIFDENQLDENAIGFNWDNGDVVQILIVPDPLSHESDTLSVPIYLKPQIKLSLGCEWHGVMRRARGWVVGGAVEWTLVKDKITRLYEVSKEDPDDWPSIDLSSIYDVEHEATNYVQLRLFAGWSPWNMPWFLRAEMCLSPDKLESGISLGYRW
jgi:hypothetical protein